MVSEGASRTWADPGEGGRPTRLAARKVNKIDVRGFFEIPCATVSIHGLFQAISKQLLARLTRLPGVGTANLCLGLRHCLKHALEVVFRDSKGLLLLPMCALQSLLYSVLLSTVSAVRRLVI